MQQILDIKDVWYGLIKLVGGKPLFKKDGVNFSYLYIAENFPETLSDVYTHKIEGIDIIEQVIILPICDGFRKGEEKLLAILKNYVALGFKLPREIVVILVRYNLAKCLQYVLSQGCKLTGSSIIYCTDPEVFDVIYKHNPNKTKYIIVDIIAYNKNYMCTKLVKHIFENKLCSPKYYAKAVYQSEFISDALGYSMFKVPPCNDIFNYIIRYGPTWRLKEIITLSEGAIRADKSTVEVMLKCMCPPGVSQFMRNNYPELMTPEVNTLIDNMLNFFAGLNL